MAMGDCAAVQYSGAGGRDPLFPAENFIPFLEKHIKPLLEGRDVSEFRSNAKFFDELKVEGKQLHTAIRYGLSQALLDATALASNRLKAEVVCDEWHLPVVAEPIPLFGQSGDDRYNAVDKMILKHVDVLPHGLINNVDEKLGRQGEKLRAYVEWLAKRIVELRTEDTYKPSLHIDVYGTIGLIFDKDPIRCAEYIASLQEQAGDLELYIEGPVDAGNKPDQIRLMKGIMDHLKNWVPKSKSLLTNGVTPVRTSSTSRMPAAVTWFRSKPLTWVLFTTSLTRCCTARNTVWKHTRAVPVTKPTSVRVPVCISRLRHVRCVC